MYTSHISWAQNTWSLQWYIYCIDECILIHHYHLRSIVYTRIHSWGYTFYVLRLTAQSCLTFCVPVDCSLPGSFVHGGSPGKNTSGLPCPPPEDLLQLWGKCVISYVPSTHIAQFQCPKNTVCSVLHLSSPPLNPWKLMFFYHHNSFALSRMSYIWNYTVCSFFRLASFTNLWLFSQIYWNLQIKLKN